MISRNQTNLVLQNPTHHSSLVFLVLTLFAVGLYLFNISGWLIHDDEGADFYKVWQLQLGKAPGIDFVAEKGPSFCSLAK